MNSWLDKIWLHQAVKFDFTGELTGTGNRSLLVVLGWVQIFPLLVGWVGSHKMDPWTTLRWTYDSNLQRDKISVKNNVS